VTVSSGGTWYFNQQVLPVAAKTSYSTPLSLNIPAGSYQAAVCWRSTRAATFCAAAV